MNKKMFIDKYLGHIDWKKVAEEERRNETWRNSPEGKQAIKEYNEIVAGTRNPDQKYIDNYKKNTGRNF